nr:MAG: non-structural polyprotein [Wufeng shrew hepe-like virus 1]
MEPERQYPSCAREPIRDDISNYYRDIHQEKLVNLIKLDFAVSTQDLVTANQIYGLYFQPRGTEFRSHAVFAIGHKLCQDYLDRKFTKVRNIEVGADVNKLLSKNDSCHFCYKPDARDESRISKAKLYALENRRENVHRLTNLQMGVSDGHACQLGFEHCSFQAPYMKMNGVYDISYEDLYEGFKKHGTEMAYIAMILPPGLAYDRYGEQEYGYSIIDQGNNVSMVFKGNELGYTHKKSTWKQWVSSNAYNGPEFSILFEKFKNIGPYTIITATRTRKPARTIAPLVNDLINYVPLVDFTKCTNDVLDEIKSLSFSSNHAKMDRLIKRLPKIFLRREIHSKVIANAIAREDENFRRQQVAANVKAYMNSVLISMQEINVGQDYTAREFVVIAISMFLQASVYRQISTKTIGNCVKTIKSDLDFLSRLDCNFNMLYKEVARFFGFESSEISDILSKHGDHFATLLFINEKIAISEEEIHEHNLQQHVELEYEEEWLGYTSVDCGPSSISWLKDGHDLNKHKYADCLDIHTIKTKHAELMPLLHFTPGHVQPKLDRRNYCKHSVGFLCRPTDQEQFYNARTKIAYDMFVCKPFPLTNKGNNTHIKLETAVSIFRDYVKLDCLRIYEENVQNIVKEPLLYAQDLLGLIDFESFDFAKHPHLDPLSVEILCTPPGHDISKANEILSHYNINVLDRYNSNSMSHNKAEKIHRNKNVCCLACMREVGMFCYADLGSEGDDEQVVGTATMTIKTFIQTGKIFVVKVQRAFSLFAKSVAGTCELYDIMCSLNVYTIGHNLNEFFVTNVGFKGKFSGMEFTHLHTGNNSIPPSSITSSSSSRSATEEVPIEEVDEVSVPDIDTSDYALIKVPEPAPDWYINIMGESYECYPKKLANNVIEGYEAVYFSLGDELNVNTDGGIHLTLPHENIYTALEIALQDLINIRACFPIKGLSMLDPLLEDHIMINIVGKHCMLNRLDWIFFDNTSHCSRCLAIECFDGEEPTEFEGYVTSKPSEYEVPKASSVKFELPKEKFEQIFSALCKELKESSKEYGELNSKALKAISSIKSRDFATTITGWAGCPGGGKSTTVRSYCSPEKYTIITPFKRLCEEYVEKGYKSVTFIKALTYNLSRTPIVIDEAFAMSPGVFLALLLKSPEVVVVGDPRQMYHVDERNFYKGLKVRDMFDWGQLSQLNVSFTLPLDCCLWLNREYGYKIKSRNNLIDSIKMCRGEPPKDKEVYCFTTNMEKFHRNYTTIAKIQGRRTEVSNLLAEANAHALIKKIPEQVVVAISRHSKQLRLFAQGGFTTLTHAPLELRHHCQVYAPAKYYDEGSNYLFTGVNFKPTPKKNDYVATVGREVPQTSKKVRATERFEKLQGMGTVNYKTKISCVGEEKTLDIELPDSANRTLEQVGISPYDSGIALSEVIDDHVDRECLKTEERFWPDNYCPDIQTVREIMEYISPTTNLDSGFYGVHMQNLGNLDTKLKIKGHSAFKTDLGEISSKTIRRMPFPLRGRPHHFNDGNQTLHCMLSRYGQISKEFSSKQAQREGEKLFSHLNMYISDKVSAIDYDELSMCIGEYINKTVQKGDVQHSQEYDGTLYTDSTQIQCFLKSQVKADLKSDAWLRPDSQGAKAGQGISAQPKAVNLIVGGLVRALEKKIRQFIDPRILMAQGFSKEHLNMLIKDRLKNCGDCKGLEVDVSQLDQQRGEHTDHFMRLLCKRFGVEDTLMNYMTKLNVKWTLDGRDMLLQVIRHFQSGRSDTLLSNTLVVIAFVVTYFDIESLKLLLAQGDDIAAIAESIKIREEKKHIKLELTPNPGFVGNILADKLVPDLPRLVTKLTNRVFSQQSDLDSYKLGVKQWFAGMDTQDDYQQTLLVNARKYKISESDASELLNFLISFARGRIFGKLSDHDIVREYVEQYEYNPDDFHHLDDKLTPFSEVIREKHLSNNAGKTLRTVMHGLNNLSGRPIFQASACGISLCTQAALSGALYGILPSVGNINIREFLPIELSLSGNAARNLAVALVVLVYPIHEEFIKRHDRGLFKYFELFLKFSSGLWRFPLTYLPSTYMHMLTPRMPYHKAVLTHMAFNALACYMDLKHSDLMHHFDLVPIIERLVPVLTEKMQRIRLDDMLNKICMRPDLFDPLNADFGYAFNYANRLVDAIPKPSLNTDFLTCPF